MKYLIIDASLNGTGIRNTYEGGYVNSEELELNPETRKRLKNWLKKYENEHYNGYVNKKGIELLDNEGRDIALIIKKELKNVKIEYFSDAKMTKLPLAKD